MNKLSIKYFLAIMIVIMLLFFSNDFGLIDIQKTAIVLAVGIDRETEEFNVTFQIASPKKSSETSSSEGQIVSAKGKTVAEAVSTINYQTGWYPKFIYCNIIILGEKTCETNIFESLDFFLRSESLQDSTIVACCQDTANKALSSLTVTDKVTGIALTKILSEESKKTGKIFTTNLKDISIKYFENGSSFYLPYIKTAPLTSAESSENQSNGSSSGGGDSSGNSTGSGGNSAVGSATQNTAQKQLFDASQSMLFKKGVGVGMLSAEENYAINIIKNKIRLSSVSFKHKNENITASLRVSKHGSSLKIENGEPVLNIILKATIVISDMDKSKSIVEITSSEIVSQSILNSLKAYLTEQITSCFNTARKVDCDVFNLTNELYRSYFKDFNRLQSGLLNTVKLNVDIKLLEK